MPSPGSSVTPWDVILTGSENPENSARAEGSTWIWPFLNHRVSSNFNTRASGNPFLT